MTEDKKTPAEIAAKKIRESIGLICISDSDEEDIKEFTTIITEALKEERAEHAETKAELSTVLERLDKVAAFIVGEPSQNIHELYDYGLLDCKRPHGSPNWLTEAAERYMRRNEI